MIVIPAGHFVRPGWVQRRGRYFRAMDRTMGWVTGAGNSPRRRERCCSNWWWGGRHIESIRSVPMTGASWNTGGTTHCGSPCAFGRPERVKLDASLSTPPANPKLPLCLISRQGCRVSAKRLPSLCHLFVRSTNNGGGLIHASSISACYLMQKE